MRTCRILVVGVVLLLLMAGVCMASPTTEELISGDPQTVPVPGMATMVDLGAKKCVPCKMMIPVIEGLSKEYEGKVAVVFIDVWKNPDQGKKFGISSIPTQIFYDASGKEITRHVGFMSKKAVREVFQQQLGVQ